MRNERRRRMCENLWRKAEDAKVRSDDEYLIHPIRFSILYLHRFVYTVHASDGAPLFNANLVYVVPEDF